MKNHTSDHYRRALQHFIQSMIVAAFTPALIFGITIGTSCAGSGTWILNPITTTGIQLPTGLPIPCPGR